MRTINDEWEPYRKALTDNDADDDVVDDHYGSFLSGAQAMLGLIHGHSQRDVEKIVSHLDCQIDAYLAAQQIRTLE